MRKYEMLQNDRISIGNLILYRIKLLRSLRGNLVAGTLGGYIQAEKNLSHDGNCWVADNARVYGKAVVKDNALVKDTAEICGRAEISGSAEISGESKFSECAKASNLAKAHNAVVSGVTHLK